MIPTKEQLNTKWWHRFFKVILIVSTIIVSFVFVSLISNEGGFDWERSKYVYSFESDYSKHEGEERDCSYHSYYYTDDGVEGGRTYRRLQREGIIATSGIRVSFECGNLTLSEFISKYCENKPTESICLKTESFIPTSGILIESPKVENIINSEGVQSKLIHYWDWKIVTKDVSILIALLTAIIIGWIALLKYGIYKAILYIVYGRN